MSEWYYAIDGEQSGPVSDRELHDLAGNGSVQPTDLVWQEGFVDWMPASTVSGLFPQGAATPPPIQRAMGGASAEFAETQIGPDVVDAGNPYAAGGWQPAGQTAASAPPRTPDGLKVPLLISLISNCAIAAIWAITCFGIIFAIPLGILAWNEYQLWQRVDRADNQWFGAEAKRLSVWQIVAGVLTLNAISLVCGILLMIEGGRHETAAVAA